ncbi:MAG: tRNA pseudouridine(55) synthase TruB [Ruminococcaceae bacterium]|nr:tRNA pseudouridine(55) synthase TruB [Oscillospiraceae bacterium]
MANNQPDTVTSGVLIVNKHAGVTSHRIISICRRMFNTRQVGHTGTLDPMATGVLPILIGRAVKASDYLMMHDKEYVCEMKLGLTTDTEDITGEVLSQSDKIPSEDEVMAVISSFVGKLKQIPPMYSAVKVGGRKLIDIAREGGEIEREARDVEIYAIEPKKISEDTYSMRVECSKGTYIRTLCSDIGKTLGCGAVMSSLVRTRTGSFTLDKAVSIEELDNMSSEERMELPIPVESLFEELPLVNVSDFYAKLVRGGTNLYQKKLKVSIEDGQLCRIRQRGVFIALGRGDTVDGEAVIRPEKLFVIDPPAQSAEKQ